MSSVGDLEVVGVGEPDDDSLLLLLLPLDDEEELARAAEVHCIGGSGRLPVGGGS